MNKLLFNYERQFNSNISLIANNHKDLQDYLEEKYDWDVLEVNEEHVVIDEKMTFERDIVPLVWVKHI